MVGKRSLQFIKEESVRKASFKRRYQSLKKKIHELSTLCGVDACMITYEPMHDGDGDGLMKLDTWPPNQEQVKKTINRYQQLDEKMKKKNSVGLTDFIKAQNKRIEQGFAKGNWIDCLSKDQLMEISATLDSKIHTVDDKIKLIDGNQRSQEEDIKLIEYHGGLQNQQQAHCNLMPMPQKQMDEYPSLPLMIPPNNLYGDSTATVAEFSPCAATAPLMNNPVMSSAFKDIYDLPNMNYEPLMIDYCPMTNPVNLMNGYDFNNYYMDHSSAEKYFSDDQGASTSSGGEMYFSDQGASTSLSPSNLQSDQQYYLSYPPSYMMPASSSS
ncbi:Mads-box transcription factor family protein [Thalictrum thalictroides]|uniref:Mads-box transcription factor family protein n=1 Tax=Thalictrum thalictroides TaxID=46969 RepID=A0A7J6WVS0_THATH|nr:Mads-box transcription factor family protein [Thalictrum thalictroides]